MESKSGPGRMTAAIKGDRQPAGRDAVPRVDGRFRGILIPARDIKQTVEEGKTSENSHRREDFFRF